MKICFVSYEIAPTTKGGAGALIANTLRYLLSYDNQDYEFVLLLDIPVEEYVRFEWHDRLHLPNHHRVRSYRVEELCADLPYQREAFACEALWRSYRFDHALRKVMLIEQPDLIEFFDYTGVAYLPLLQKLNGLYSLKSNLIVRYHMTTEPIHTTKPTIPSEDTLLTYRLEARALELAEGLLFPSQNVCHWVKNWYKLPEAVQCRISPPALVRVPTPISVSQGANKILYLGYMNFSKGVDSFVSAALFLMEKFVASNISFLMVGGDYDAPPAGFSSFSNYLMARIPSYLRYRFQFMGQISHQELQQILPEVRFAVIPSYIESFGYALHELYAAGIPVIVRNLPVFLEYFRHEENALVFDGTVEDLAYQMQRLWQDDALRKKITRPYNVLPSPLGDCYSHGVTSWMKNPTPSTQLALKALVLTELKKATSLPSFDPRDLIQLSLEKNENPPLLFLGKLWWVYDGKGEPLPLDQWRTGDIMIVMCEDDEADPYFLTKAVNLLGTYSHISYVGSWRKIEDKIDTFPFDAASEVMPFLEGFIPSRTVFRTKPGVHLFDLFDNRAGVFSEILHLWLLEEAYGKGVILPEVYVRMKRKSLPGYNVLDSASFNYLLMNATLDKKARIGQYILTQNQRPVFGISNSQLDYYKLAELDLKLLLKKLSAPPLGWVFKRRKNFRKLLERYL